MHVDSLLLLNSKAQVRALSSASWVLDPGARGLLSIISYKETTVYPPLPVPCSTNEFHQKIKSIPDPPGSIGLGYDLLTLMLWPCAFFWKEGDGI